MSPVNRLYLTGQALQTLTSCSSDLLAARSDEIIHKYSMTIQTSWWRMASDWTTNTPLEQCLSAQHNLHEIEESDAVAILAL